MPRPPPPAEALIAIGQPYSSPSRITVAASRISSVVPGTIGTPAAAMRCRAPILEPIASIADGRRADPDEPRLLAGARERGVLGQEPVARVDRLRPARRAAAMIRSTVQVALRRRARPDQPRLVGAPHVQRAAIGLRVDGDRADPELAQGAEDTDGDLAAIGDEHLAERRGHGRGSLVKASRAGYAGRERRTAPGMPALLAVRILQTPSPVREGRAGRCSQPTRSSRAWRGTPADDARRERRVNVTRVADSARSS